MPKVDAILNGVENVPAAPKLLIQLLSQLSDVNASLDRVVDMIAFDPGLTSRLLQVCNSAFYGLSRPVNHVSEAVNRLGYQAVYHIVAVVSGEQMIKPASDTGLDADQLWKHAVTVAFAAQFIAKGVGADSSLLFTAGVLHDIGKLILGQVLKGEYAKMIRGSSLSGIPLQDVELSCFGVTHSMVGARLLQRWKFSPLMVDSVCYHHNPSESKEAARFAAIVQLADVLAHSVEAGQPISEESTATFASSLGILDIEMNELERYYDEVHDSLKFVEAMCRSRS